jgi:hypothetical protein
MASTEDHLRVVSEAEYTQLCNELRSLVKAWSDRLHVPEYVASCVLLQIGATISQWQGMPIEKTLEYVRHAWMTAQEVPGASEEEDPDGLS